MNKSPAEKPQLLTVIQLDEPAPSRITTGRKPKLKTPPIPQAVLDGMTELEQQWFWYTVDAFTQDYGPFKPSDVICLYQAALECINTWRVQAKQMKSGEVISMARQHPGVQMRAWLDMMDVTRKARTRTGKAQEDSEEAKQIKEALKALSTTA